MGSGAVELRSNVCKRAYGRRRERKRGGELADVDLQARRRDLEKRLGKLKRPIVVVIDDIDRLPPEQVRIVFQMLKAVCDFDRVSYLVAYAPEPVKKALSYGDTYDSGGRW